MREREGEGEKEQGRERVRKQGRESVLHLLVHSLKACNGWGQSLQLGIESRSCMWLAST